MSKALRSTHEKIGLWVCSFALMCLGFTSQPLASASLPHHYVTHAQVRATAAPKQNLWHVASPH